MQEVKAWFKSPSNWIVILAIVGVVVDKLIADGVLPNEGWAAIVSLVVGLVLKRGYVESTAIKANAIVAAANPTPPPHQ
jgi:hypothetical protein